MSTPTLVRGQICRAAFAAWLLGLVSTPVLAQQPIGLVPVPPENPLTEAKVNLGKALFWEEQLSLTGTVACGTCHQPAAGGSDPRTAVGGQATTHPGPDGVFGNADDSLASAGVPLHDAAGNYLPSQHFGLRPQVGRRKSMTPHNSAFETTLLWDGRAGSSFRDPLTNELLIPAGAALESQSLLPLLDPTEMGHAGSQAAGLPARLQGVTPLALAANVPAALRDWIAGRDYVALFTEAFGTPAITPARMAFALASYQRVLSDTQTPFDRVLAGDQNAMTPEQQLGRQVFEGSRCAICHVDALHAMTVSGLSRFRYIGVRPPDDDLGRFVHDNDSRLRGSFRIPSLRNVGLRAPYMHNGRFPSLDSVVEFYRRGGDFTAPNKDVLINPLGISEEQKAAMLAYLQGALTDPRIAARQPPFDTPTLYTESAHVPAIIGSGVAGTHGVPQISALEPPLASNRNFTVGLSRALAGVAATLVVSRTDPGVQSSVPTGDFARVDTLTQAGNADSDGYASVQLDLSQVADLSGQTLFGRYYVADPAAPNGLAVSQAFRMTVFGERMELADAIFRDGFQVP